MRSFFKFRSCQHVNHNHHHHHHSKRNDEMRYEREMTLWRPFRYCGQIASFCAFLLGCVSASSENWMAGKNFKISIWSTCYYNETETETFESCEIKRPLWMTTVIGLLVTALFFGTLANVLSFFGLCSSTLRKKIYYFNSAGEINLVCGLATATGHTLYGVGMYIVYKMSPNYLSYAFGLGCFSSALFLTAAVCMCVDDIVGSVKKLFGYDDDDDEDDVRV